MRIYSHLVPFFILPPNWSKIVVVSLNFLPIATNLLSPELIKFVTWLRFGTFVNPRSLMIGPVSCSVVQLVLWNSVETTAAAYSHPCPECTRQPSPYIECCSLPALGWVPNVATFDSFVWKRTRGGMNWQGLPSDKEAAPLQLEPLLPILAMRNGQPISGKCWPGFARTNHGGPWVK